MDRSFPIAVLNNKQKCPYISLYMDCYVGGNATAECYHPKFHGTCRFKQKAERNHKKDGEANG